MPFPSFVPSSKDQTPESSYTRITSGNQQFDVFVLPINNTSSSTNTSSNQIKLNIRDDCLEDELKDLKLHPQYQRPIITNYTSPSFHHSNDDANTYQNYIEAKHNARERLKLNYNQASPTLIPLKKRQVSEIMNC